MGAIESLTKLEPWQKVALLLHMKRHASAISCVVPIRFIGAIAIAGANILIRSSLEFMGVLK